MIVLRFAGTCSIAHQQPTHGVAQQRNVLQRGVFLNLVLDLYSQSVPARIDAIIGLEEAAND